MMEFNSERMVYVIETLRRNDMKATEIQNILETAWPNDTPNVRRIQQIVKSLKDGERVTCVRAEGQGRPISDLRTNSVALVQATIEEDNDLSLRELADMLDLSESMVYRILTNELEQIWMHTLWVPHIITDAHRQQRIDNCRTMLLSFESRIAKSNTVTVDEKWFYARHLKPSNTTGSWIGPDGDRQQTARRSTMEKKFLAIIAVSTRGEHYFCVLPKGKTVNSELYIEFLQAMRQHFANLREPLLMENIRFVHDNARPHVSINTQAYLNSTAVRILKQPPYSPDCNLCDRYIFPRLEAIRGRGTFASKADLELFLSEQLPLFTKARMNKALTEMMKHFNLIIESNGNYV